MEQTKQKNECCKDFANIKFVKTENVDNEFQRVVYECTNCNNTYYGKLNQISKDSKSFQAIDELTKKGVSIDTIIIGGKSAIKYIIPDMGKIISKTREIAKTKKIQCETHEITDIYVDEKGIFCKKCGNKLKLIQAWVLGESKQVEDEQNE